MRLFGEIMGAFDVPVEIETESREIRCDRRLAGRGVVKTLKNVVKFSGVILCAIESAKRVQRFTPQRWIFCDAQPQLFGLFLRSPFRSQTREDKFALGLFVCRLFCGAPELIKFIRSPAVAG